MVTGGASCETEGEGGGARRDHPHFCRRFNPGGGTGVIFCFPNWGGGPEKKPTTKPARGDANVVKKEYRDQLNVLGLPNEMGGIGRQDLWGG